MGFRDYKDGSRIIDESAHSTIVPVFSLPPRTLSWAATHVRDASSVCCCATRRILKEANGQALVSFSIQAKSTEPRAPGVPASSYSKTNNELFLISFSWHLGGTPNGLPPRYVRIC